MIELTATVAVFTGLILVLSMLIIAAQFLLKPHGSVTVLINGTRSIVTGKGGTLLEALAAEQIFLAAACGGRGTCGQCKVEISGSDVPWLAAEAAHLGRRAVAAGMRLACMQRLYQNVRIRVPSELLGARRFSGTIRSTRCLTTYLKEIVIDIPEHERFEFTAGDYVLVESPPHQVRFAEFRIDAPYREEWARYQLLDLVSRSDRPQVRAYSLANYPTEDRALKLVVRIAAPPHDAPAGTPPGVVSSYLFSLTEGAQLQITGPYGEFHASENDREMVMIAGGAGIAPMRSIIFDQLERRRSTRKIAFWYGARNVRELCYVEELDALAEIHAHFSWHAALSDQDPGDGWQGYTGFVHEAAYEHYLKSHPAPESAEYYLCGPPLMTAGATHMLAELGVHPQDIRFDDFGP